MNYWLIVKDRATQDLRQQANYILVNGNADAAVKSWMRRKQRLPSWQRLPAWER